MTATQIIDKRIKQTEKFLRFLKRQRRLAQLAAHPHRSEDQALDRLLDDIDAIGHPEPAAAGGYEDQVDQSHDGIFA